MQQVIVRNIPICGHPVLEEELRFEWPDANWFFPSGGGYEGMIEAYARGDCGVLAMGREDMIHDHSIDHDHAVDHDDHDDHNHAAGKEEAIMDDIDISSGLCKHGLVYTDDVLHEFPIAFPIRRELASDFNYWMYIADTAYGIDLKSAKAAFIEENGIKPQCVLELSDSRSSMDADNDFIEVRPGNMFFPIMFYVVCAIIAAVMQLVHDRNKKKGHHATAFGRKSMLSIYKSSSSMNLDHSNLRLFPREAAVRRLTQESEASPRILTVQRSMSMTQDNTQHNGSDTAVDEIIDDARRGQIVDFPGASVPGDEFHENATTGPSSIFKGFTIEMNQTNENADEAVEEEDNDIGHRIEELVESGAIEEVLDCFDFFQELKKLKKDQ